MIDEKIALVNSIDGGRVVCQGRHIGVYQIVDIAQVEARMNRQRVLLAVPVQGNMQRKGHEMVVDSRVCIERDEVLIEPVVARILQQSGYAGAFGIELIDVKRHSSVQSRLLPRSRHETVDGRVIDSPVDLIYEIAWSGGYIERELHLSLVHLFATVDGSLEVTHIANGGLYVGAAAFCLNAVVNHRRLTYSAKELVDAAGAIGTAHAIDAQGHFEQAEPS